jgi:hypothetical protein
LPTKYFHQTGNQAELAANLLRKTDRAGLVYQSTQIAIGIKLAGYAFG